MDPVSFIRRRRASRRADAQLAEALAYHREHRDAEERAESTPPDDETLTWLGVLVAEAYGPSHVTGLLRSIERLGWDQARDLGTGRSLRDWIVAARGQVAGGGLWPLTLTRERRRTIDIHAYHAPLPDGVAFARGLFLTPTPALTVVVLYFAFQDDAAARVDGLLREHTRSEGRRLGEGWVVEPVANVRLERTASARRELRELAGRFLSEQLPGAFAADLEGEHPACEVVTTRRWDPLADIEEARARGALSYLWAVGLDSHIDGWTAADLDGWRLELPHGFSRTPAMVLSARLGRVTGPDAKADPGPPSEQISSLLFHRIEGMVAMWACDALLSRLRGGPGRGARRGACRGAQRTGEPKAARFAAQAATRRRGGRPHRRRGARQHRACGVVAAVVASVRLRGDPP